MKKPQVVANRLSMRRIMAAYTRTPRWLHTISRSPLAHSSVVRDPGKGAFDHPAAWEDLKCSRWQKLLPTSTIFPSLANCLAQLIRAPLRGWVCADVRPVPHSILKPSQCPAFAFLLAPVTSVQPQVLKAWEQLLGTIEQWHDPLLVHHVGHVDTVAFSTKPSRYQPASG